MYLCTMHPILDDFARSADDELAAGMAAYLKNRFAFYGVPAPLRKDLQRQYLTREALPTLDKLVDEVEKLWEQDGREAQYFTIDLCAKYLRKFREQDLELLEYMASNRQWWDSIDPIATKLMGAYFSLYPEQRIPAVSRWLAGDDFWLQRCGILFQLKYREQTDTDLLQSAILPVRQSNEFFIQKAIGWALREYRKTNRLWVDEFVGHTDLKPLSRREALKHKYPS